jgi:hypothetical protein
LPTVNACLPVCMISTGDAVSTRAFHGLFMTAKLTCRFYQ